MNGRIVKQWLEENKMRPEELAMKLDISFSTVQKILAGKRVYGSTITLLSQVTGIPRDKLTAEASSAGTARRKAV